MKFLLLSDHLSPFFMAGTLTTNGDLLVLDILFSISQYSEGYHHMTLILANILASGFLIQE